jgi:hypothetical protein
VPRDSDAEASKDKTWRVAKQVWDNCSSAMVCRAFIHAFRIMRKIVECRIGGGQLMAGNRGSSLQRTRTQ